MSTMKSVRTRSLTPLAALVGIYVVVVIATLAALAVMSAAGSHEATQEAWVHAVIVAAFAALLPLRLRAARHDDSALKAVALIAAVLVVLNIVEALVPGLFPSWMRAEMIAVAALMIALVALTLRAVKNPGHLGKGTFEHGR